MLIMETDKAQHRTRGNHSASGLSGEELLTEAAKNGQGDGSGA